MERVSRRNLLGMLVQDCHGEEIGQVVDTWPEDGGWELEMVVVRLSRFGERRMLPAADLQHFAGRLYAPYTRAQIEDSPALHTGRHSGDDPDRAKWYWRFEERARGSRLRMLVRR
jgi:hypothetical protein